MTAWLQDQWKYLGGAVGIHLLMVLLFIGFNWRSHQAIVPQLAIQGVVVNQSQLNALVTHNAPPDVAPMPAESSEAEQQIQEQKLQEQKQEQEQVRLQQQQLQLKQKQEQARVEAEQRRLAEAEKKKQLLEQRKAAEAEQKKQQQQAEKKRLADVQQKKREAELKRQADAEAKAQKEREAELRSQMAAEEGRATAVNAGLLNQYVALIQQKVMRNWIKPQTAKSGLECEVKVTQASGGTVLSVTIGRCNGDQAVRTSIETAVQAASPLPAPPDARLFERNLLFIFKPAE